MATYEIDEIAIVDGDIVTISPSDKILGMKDDGSKFYILRWLAKR